MLKGQIASGTRAARVDGAHEPVGSGDEWMAKGSLQAWYTPGADFGRR
jgi:hypothetical protein